MMRHLLSLLLQLVALGALCVLAAGAGYVAGHSVGRLGALEAQETAAVITIDKHEAWRRVAARARRQAAPLTVSRGVK